MKEVLLVSIAFSPNVGGIETHFDDLTYALSKRGIKTWALTYKPITTKVFAPFHERKGKYVEIYRIPWLSGFFYKLVKKPFFEFIYLVPGLFLALPIFLAIKGRKLKTIHSHGLIAGFVSVFWGRVFGKRVITTTHSIYHFPKSGFYRNLALWVFGSSDKVLTLSHQSKDEILSLGADKNKVEVFTYWVDLDKFKKIEGAKKELGWEDKFVVLFVGRLIYEKGVRELLLAARLWDKNITLVIAGVGPLENKLKNALYLGRIEQSDLPKYYSAADVLVVPSIHEEGFGRVILEALACGTPVIGSNRGAIPEAMDDMVGQLIDVSVENIVKSVNYWHFHPDELLKLAKNARQFTVKRYSEKNVETIIKAYKY